MSVPIEEVEDSDDAAFHEWNELTPVPAGSQTEARPATSRTATLSDPLTTGLLAEVARRSQTIEVGPQTIEEAIQRASIDPDDEITRPGMPSRVRR